MHIPVLKKEVLEYLDPKPNENFIDATFGLGGHSNTILEKTKPNGKLLGIELDPALLKGQGSARVVPGISLALVHGSYANLKKIVEEQNFRPIHGILFDLGMSSWHLEKSGRGFTFQKNEPLDMRYNAKVKSEKLKVKSYNSKLKIKENITAQTIVNEWAEKEIVKILREYGEERFAKQISKNIATARKVRTIKTTFQLVDIIKKAVPKKFQYGRIHPATRTFQALRIAVNNELENIKTALPQALDILEKGGRIVVISFHSLEDRIVKHFFKNQAQNNLLKILTKKPITPSADELQNNPRSRSAKLRAAIKI